jgi:hypothetical protein
MDFGRRCYKDAPGSYDAERIERNLIIIFAAGAAEEAYAGSPRYVGLDRGNRTGAMPTSAMPAALPRGNWKSRLKP